MFLPHKNKNCRNDVKHAPSSFLFSCLDCSPAHPGCSTPLSPPTQDVPPLWLPYKIKCLCLIKPWSRPPWSGHSSPGRGQRSQGAGPVQASSLGVEGGAMCGLAGTPVPQRRLRRLPVSETMCNGEAGVSLQLGQNHQNLPETRTLTRVRTRTTTGHSSHYCEFNFLNVTMLIS